MAVQECFSAEGILLISLLLNVLLTIVCVCLHKQTGLDSYTALRNKHQFNQDVSNLRRATDTVVIIDIDKFKLINDTYGHAYGDTIIKEVADVILRNIRQSDRAYRIGGDEFAIITNRALEMVERIQNSLSVSVSVGIGGTYEEADTAMYVSKRK